MNKLTLSIAMLAIAGVASADILVPNGDFETAGGVGWTTDGGSWGPGAFTHTFETTGGSGDNGGYASIESSGSTWAIFVNPPEAGNAGGGIAIGDIGVTAGAVNTFTVDLKTIAGAGAGGLKVEGWNAANGMTGNSGDILATSASATWQTLTFDWAVPADTTKMIFVPLWGANSTIGYDNVGVVPEPATLGLVGLVGGAMLFIRRRFRN